MIEYEIIVQHKRDKRIEKVNVVEPSDPNFHEIVLTRAVKGCPYFPKMRVKVRGTSKRGVIERILKDKNEVNWAGNRPHFVQVKMDDGTTLLCNPAQLRRKSK